MRKLRLLFITLMLIALTSCQLQNWIPKQEVREEILTPEPTQETVLSSESTLKQGSIQDGIVLPDEGWKVYSREELDEMYGEGYAFSCRWTKKRKVIMNLKASKAVYAAVRDDYARNLVILNRTFAQPRGELTAEEAYQYAEKQSDAILSALGYEYWICEHGSVSVSGNEYQCVQMAIPTYEFHQFILMRMVNDKEMEIICLTAASEEAAADTVHLLDPQTDLEYLIFTNEPVQVEYKRGKWTEASLSLQHAEGPKYVSSFSNLCIELPIGWIYDDDRRIAEDHGIEYAEGMNLEEALAEKEVIWELWAEHTVHEQWIAVTYLDYGEEASMHPLEFFVESSEDEILRKGAEFGLEKIDLAPELLGGQEYLCLTLGVPGYDYLEKHFYRMNGNWLIVVDVYAAEDSDDMEDMLGYFKKLEEA